MVSSALWNKFARADFQRAQNCTSPIGRVLFELFENPRVQIYSKVHEKIMRFLVNNIDAKISNQNSLLVNDIHEKPYKLYRPTFKNLKKKL